MVIIDWLEYSSKPINTSSCISPINFPKYDYYSSIPLSDLLSITTLIFLFKSRCLNNKISYCGLSLNVIGVATLSALKRYESLSKFAILYTALTNMISVDLIWLGHRSTDTHECAHYTTQ